MRDRGVTTTETAAPSGPGPGSFGFRFGVRLGFGIGCRFRFHARFRCRVGLYTGRREPPAAGGAAADRHQHRRDPATNGKIDFQDHFIRPNYSAALTELNGRLGAFSSDSPRRRR